MGPKNHKSAKTGIDFINFLFLHIPSLSSLKYLSNEVSHATISINQKSGPNIGQKWGFWGSKNKNIVILPPETESTSKIAQEHIPIYAPRVSVTYSCDLATLSHVLSGTPNDIAKIMKNSIFHCSLG